MTKKVTNKNCLSALFPELVKEWDYDKNGTLTPDQVLPGSNHKVWWKCPQAPDHIWQAHVYRRTNSKQPSGCPFCAGQKVAASNCLSTTHPELSLEWDSQLNDHKTPNNVTAGHNGTVHWICSENHSHKWQAKVSLRTSASTGCPYCAHQRVDTKESLEAKFPDISRYWHPTLNGSLSAAEVLPQSNQHVWWQCPASNDHIWTTSVYCAVKTKRFCPYCSGRKVTKNSSLEITHPQLATQWHPSKNGNLSPASITSSHSKLVWWKCPAANDHEWEAKPNKRVRRNSGCPVCANRKIVKSNCLATTHPEMAKEWNLQKNLPLTPESIGAGYGDKVWWQCTQHREHIWQTSPKSRINNRSGCPFCSNKKVSKTNNLAYTHPDLAKQWHPSLNGGLTPNNVVSGSTKKVWWKCSKKPEHVWQTKVEQRTRLNSQCPFCSECVSKESILIFQRLESLIPGLIYEGQNGTDLSALTIKTWRRPFDAAIPHLSIFIEYDGYYYHKDQYNRDLRKNIAAEQLGYTVLRIRPIPLDKTSDLDISVPQEFDADEYIKLIMEKLSKLFGLVLLE